MHIMFKKIEKHNFEKKKKKEKKRNIKNDYVRRANFVVIKTRQLITQISITFFTRSDYDEISPTAPNCLVPFGVFRIEIGI